MNERKWGFSVQKKKAIVWYKSSNEKRCSLFISSIFFILLHSGDLRGIAHKTQKIWLLGAMLKRNLIAWNFLHFPFLPYQLQPHYKEISRILFLLLLSSCFLIPFVCCFWGDAWKILELWKYFCVIYKNAKIEWV